MNKWWNWVLGIALFCLLFLVIPIRYTGRNKEMLESMFNDYIEKFNKTYKNDSNEYQTRFQHFVASVEEIDRLNSESRGPDQYRALFGLTYLSDMSKSEYRDIHLSDERMLKSPHMYGKSWSKLDGRLIYDVDDVYNHHRQRHRFFGNEPHNDINIILRRKRASLPLQLDWRSKNVIGPVRSQGLCGACWAFSTIGAMEAMAAMKTGKLQTLSVQEAIDCAGLGISGCAGGDICLLLDWLMITKMPVELDNSYPLRLIDGACRAKANATGVQVTSFTCDDFVSAEEKILEALATHGPVVVAVNALTWQNYLGGVVHYHCSGSPVDLNHAVELVGYDLTADVPYYIAKNSWGPEFGLGGYIHLAIGSNVCGLANEVATVSVK